MRPLDYLFVTALIILGSFTYWQQYMTDSNRGHAQFVEDRNYELRADFISLQEKVKELETTTTFMSLEGEMGVMCETVGIRKFNTVEYILRRDEKHGIVCVFSEKYTFNYDELFKLYEQVAYEERGE